MFLGIIIDENRTWKNHIDTIPKTISRNQNETLCAWIYFYTHYTVL